MPKNNDFAFGQVVRLNKDFTHSDVFEDSYAETIVAHEGQKATVLQQDNNNILIAIASGLSFWVTRNDLKTNV